MAEERWRDRCEFSPVRTLENWPEKNREPRAGVAVKTSFLFSRFAREGASNELDESILARRSLHD